MALTVVPPGLLPTRAVAQEFNDLPVVDTGASETTPEGASFEDLAASGYFRVDISKMPPDDGYLDTVNPPLMNWNSSANRAEVNSQLNDERRYLLMLRRTAIEEALKARGMLYLLIGGNEGIGSYLQTHERSGTENLREALCRLDPEHESCRQAQAADVSLTFALPCETKALFGLYDERCTDARLEDSWGGHRAVTAPSSRTRDRQQAQARHEESLFENKFGAIKRAEQYLVRSAPAASDYATAGLQGAQQLRRRVLGALIFHSLQIIQLQRLHRFISEDLPRDVAAQNSQPVRPGRTEYVDRQLQDRGDAANRLVMDRYREQLDRIEAMHNTILAQVPFLAVRVGNRPFYEFVYCFLQGRSEHAQASTQYCGNGAGFPDYYGRLQTPSAEEYVRNHEVAELPQSFRGPFEDLMRELESGSGDLEQRILNHSFWAFKKLLTESLAANTASLVALSNASPRFITTNGGSGTEHCRVVGRHCRMLENLARYGLLHEKVKRRFGTYANTDFFPNHRDSSHGMDQIRDRIVRSLERLDSRQELTRTLVDVYLWGITVVEVGVTFGMGAAVASFTQMSVRYAMTTAALMNLAAAYGEYQDSQTSERYIAALFRGIPGTVSPGEMAEAEQMTVNDAIQFHASLVVAIGDYMVLDRIFRTVGTITRGTARVVLSPRPVREWILRALQRSRALAEAGGEGVLRGAIRPILTNRAIRTLEGIGLFGKNFMEPVSHAVALQRLAQLEGRSVAWMNARLGERLTTIIQNTVTFPGRMNERAALFLHRQLFNQAALEAGSQTGVQALRSGGVRGWFRWIRGRLFSRPMAETIRQAEVAALAAHELAAREVGLDAARSVLSNAFGRQMTEAQVRQFLQQTARDAEMRVLQDAASHAAAHAMERHLARTVTRRQAAEILERTVLSAEETAALVARVLSTPMDTALSVPWLRDFIGTELYSAGIMTLISVYQRHNAGTLAETTPQVVADAGMDLAFMFFAIMRSPSRVDRISRVLPRDRMPGRPALYVAHPFARSATMLTPIVAISSVAGAASTVMMGEESIDTPEEWARYLRQTRNRMLFDVNHIALNSPYRATLREGAYEQFGGGGNLGRLLVNGYYIFDFTVLCYPLYIYGRDALGLDRLPDEIRATLGDGNVFMSIRGPDMPDTDDLLLPTASGVLERFAFGN
jgi:hypothetical protein